MLPMDGGRPMLLNGDIVLCGRSVNDSARGYTGRLAEVDLKP